MFLSKYFLNSKSSEHKDVARLLHSNFIASFSITIFTSIYLILSFQAPETILFKCTWFITLCIIFLFRTIDHIHWRKNKNKESYSSTDAINRYTIGTLTTGIAIAIYAVYSLSHSGNLEGSAIIIILCALSGGAANVLSANKLSVILYPLLLIAPASITLYLSPNEYLNLFSILGVAYCLTLIIIAIKSSNFTLSAIRLKNENIELINQMEHKVSQRAEKIYQLSSVDSLTGLFNRSTFIKKLSEQLTLAEQNNETLALLFVDLDGFKKINDTLGHTTGDSLLKLTAERINNPKNDNKLVCRWGGDEFLIAYSDTDQSQAEAYATQLINDISTVYNFDGYSLSIGATAGISLYPYHADKTDKLIRYADTAMYVQKKIQPQSIRLFDQEMNNRLKQEEKLKRSLSKAIDKNQFRVVYQPIVISGTGEVKSFEALLRWNLDGQAISPLEFIGIAEQYGLINEIGDWVLLQACVAASQWCDGNQAISPKVSVNVSVLQFNSNDFTDRVRSILKSTGLSSNKLIIEITESIFSEDKLELSNQISELQSMGVEISIDDFGSGYSSLSVVQNLSANTIKIDQEFVKSIHSGGLIIIEAVKEIAKKLECLVVVEGVETEEQKTILTNLEIDMLQGYYFSTPLESDRVDAYITEALN